jgi:hypothetical protein
MLVSLLYAVTLVGFWGSIWLIGIIFSRTNTAIGCLSVLILPTFIWFMSFVAAPYVFNQN